MGSYVPSYCNPSPIYQPAMRVISAISQSDPVVITTTIDHNYLTGTIVRIDIPPKLGMQQLNQAQGTITVLTPTTFSININTTNFDPFTLPSSFPPGYNDAQVVPIGEDNDTLLASTVNVLPY